MGQGCRRWGLRLSSAIAALALGVALLVFAVAPSRPLAGSHRGASLAAPAGASARSPVGGPSPSLSPPFARSLPSSASNPYRAGDVILAFRPGVSSARQHTIERAAGGSIATRLGPPIKAVGHGRVSTQEFISPMKLRVPANQEQAVIARLRRDPAVAYAELNYLQQGTALPNDPSFALQWGSYNTGQNIRSQNGNEEFGAWEAGFTGADDGALKAWQVSTGSRSIVIGEVDTGVDYNHPDLAANIWSNPGGVGGCPAGTHGYNVVNKTCNPIDEDGTYGGHGTHVAGIMGAAANNGTGVAGMNWQTTILPVRWMNNASAGETGSLIEAMQWEVAAKQAGVNVRVVNDSDTFFGTAKSEALSNEIDVLGANNILFVSSSGNTGNNNDEVAVQRYPCSYDRPNEICVAASNNKDELPSWANYGPHTVQLAAPGQSIYSTFRSSKYGWLTGGSMAAPQVSGAAALILSVAPTLTAAQLRADILENVDKFPAMESKLITGGRLDVCKALPGCTGTLPASPATFGKTGIGTSSEGYAAERKRVSKFALASAAAVSKLSVFLEPGGTSGSEVLKGVIYSDVGGKPEALLGTSEQLTYKNTDASGRYELKFASPVKLAAGNYWIGTISGPTLNVAKYRYDNVTGARDYNSNAFATGPTNPFGAFTTDNQQTSLYATYTPAPVNELPPSVTGIPKQGQTLAEVHGTWTNEPSSFTYQWLQCDNKGANCSAIAGAIAQTYVPVPGDVGHTIKVQETAGNEAGTSSPATSSATAIVIVAAPVSKAVPTMTGTAQQGQTLTEAHGEWENNPTSFAYQWQQCDGSGNNCKAISGATSQTYVPAAGDVGRTLKVAETASNEGGTSSPAASNASAAVTPPTPTSIEPPTITGTAQQGQTLTEHEGTWTNEPTSFTYQWLQCGSKGTSCSPIAGATAKTYVPVAADVGHTIRVQESASNAGGTSSPATSTAASAAVLPAPPASVSPPSISGIAQQGQTLTEVHGEWENNPTSFTYQWLQCGSKGATCSPIAGATGQTYVPSALDVGHTLRVRETASNEGGTSSPATSGASALVVPPPPENAGGPPSISGTAQQGQTLTESHGEWTNEPTSFAYQWLQCGNKGATCSAIAGATGQTYVPVPGDVGHTIRVRETASNEGGTSIPSTSNATAVVLPAAPTLKAPPTITGTAQQGQTLTEAHGEWENNPTSFAYQWLQCDGSGNSCKAISGATSQTYVPVAGDVGRTLKVQETASNEGGTGSPATSSASAAVVPPPPANETSPAITGTAQQGQTLTEVKGSWTNEPSGFAYQWLQCDSTGNACLPISGATGQTYVPSAGDVGHMLRVAETASNAGGSGGPATSSATAVVVPPVPANVKPPTITGTAQQGQTLTETHGEWTNSPTSFAYQWQQCDGSGSNCTAISGATGQTYAPVAGDVGRTLKVAETASNAGGSSSPASSSATAVVVPPPPANEVAPSITGTAQQGQTLTEVKGKWTNEPTGYAYQWLQCDGSGNNCTTITSATGQSYVPAAGDVGHTIKVAETASNAGGTSAPASSSATAVVVPPVPTNKAAPSISGTAQQGQTLTEVHGEWTSSPTGFAYQWQQCDGSGLNCKAIAGATSQSYVLLAGDVGHTIKVAETASNAGGTSSPATSSASAVVVPPPPANETLPAITGAAQQGQTLTEVHGTWTNEPTSFTYQWLQCDSLGSGCLPLSGATGQTYTPLAGDVGHTIKVAETASNAGGSGGPATSGATAAVVPPAPANVKPPTITGTAQKDQTLTAHTGEWTNEPTNFAYQWLQCDNKGASCAAISGATSQTYIPLAGDVGHTIRVQQTASNEGGTGSPATSAVTAVVVPPTPTNKAAPSISGTAQKGQTLTEVHGEWTNSPTGFADQWLQCDNNGANCAPISGANSQTYVLVAGDIGHTIKVQETASNEGGTSSPATSAATSAVLAPSPPTNSARPTISGEAKQGQTLTETRGTWTNEPTGFAYQWLRCDGLGSNCQPISGATSQSYMAVTADVEHTIRVQETASNEGGSGSPSSSDATALVLGVPPANVSPPSISGTPQQGQTLTESHGSWTNEPTSFTYQWLQCDGKGASCAPIAGAINQTYVPVAADVGHTIKVAEAASNGAGLGSPSSSGATAAIIPAAPTNEALPTITGTALQGQTLTEAHGAWANNPTSFAYQWLRCDGSGDNCLPISGATKQTYRLVAADIEHAIEVQESASNEGGSSSPATSTATAAVLPNNVPPPTNEVPPAITGTAQQDQTLTAVPGKWANEPMSFSYQWLQCDGTGANCSPISGATAQTYAPVASDLGHTLKVQETASNEAGTSSPATSSATAMIVPPPPANETAPAITGTPQQGQTLTEVNGSWKNAPTTFTYRWLQCDSLGNGCLPISGATSQTYVPVAGDVGHTIAVTETASNEGGTSEPVQSAATTKVLPPAPVNKLAPTITGTAQQGQTLSAHNGSWDNEPTSFAHRWLQCDGSGNNCTAISGAVKQIYVPLAGDVGHTIRVQETASNDGGPSSPATSSATAVVVPPPPTNKAAPSISGTAQQGQTLTEAHGEWENNPTSFAHQWLQCDGAGSNCTAIAGATSQSYVPVSGDVGHTLKVTESATNAGGTGGPVSSAATAVVVPPTPTNKAAPSISGTAQQGQTLTETHGEWSNSPTTYAYQWQQCDGSGNNCTAISGATKQSYVLLAGDVGHTIAVSEIASNEGGSSGPASSAATAVVVPPPPTNKAAPSISGTAQEGQTLTETHGEWSNNPTSYAYQWQQCDGSGGSCQAISGATSQTYVLLTGDVGHTIKVQEIATNAGGAGGPATSTATAAIVPPTPTNKAAPSISGTAQEGQTLTETHGEWSNNPTSFAYQWLQCDGAGNNCTAIAGATSQSYVPVSGDVGHTLRVQESATNAGGTGGPVSSAATAVVVPPPPTNKAAPTITGTAQQGQTLTETHGEWSNSPTSFAYQWQQCDGSGNNCTAIGGATGQTYVPVSGDVGHTLKVTESATNAGGTGGPVSSAATAVVAPPPPANIAAPSITGTAREGQTLTEVHGEWSNNPTSFSYQWLQCDNLGNGCLPISGATSQTYVLLAADVGHTIKVEETAGNAGGSGGPAVSNPTAVVVPPAPTSSKAPAISGTAEQGQTLTETHGEWSNSPTSYAYQWQRCDNLGNGCLPISGATGQTYVPVSGDVGHTLRVQESATNAGGTGGPVSSAATAVVVPPAPTSSKAPTISGTAQQGQTLTETHGEWSNNPTSFAYQWLQCDNLGNGCLPISGATGQTYVPVSGDVGHTLKVQESATNAGGTGGPASSSATAVVVPPAPVNTAPPSVSGTPREGQTLVEAHGEWSNNPTSFSYQWLQCDNLGNGCAAISGATSQSYVLLAGDVGHTIKVAETASNAGGSAGPVSSSATSLVRVATATVGKTAIGALTDTFASERKRVNRYGLPEAGSVSKLTVYLAPAGKAGEQVLKGVIYSDVGGKPEALLGVSEQLTFKSTNAAGWYDLPFGSPVKLAAGNYWIGVITGATNGVAGFRYDSVAGARAYNANTYASGPTSPFGAVTTDNEQFSLYATYAPSAPVGPPTNAKPPTISGTAQQGQTLTESHGSWTNEPTGFTYQWLQCDGSGNNCAAIFGATSQSYVPVAGDVGHTIKVAETAGNESGTSSPAPSGATAVVIVAAPVSKAAPTITGSAQQGQTLTEAHGEWSNNPTSFTYQWLQCDGSGNNCTAISGATSQTYVLLAGDAGHTIKVGETASNAGGSGGPVSSSATAVVLQLPPSNEAPPTITGAAQQAKTLTEVHGKWSNNPTSFAYQWLQCDGSGNNCSAISGATSQTYVPVAADVGQTIEVQETATNAGGSGGPVTSGATTAVAPPPPINKTAPAITGEAKQGQALSEHSGSWEGEPTSFAYQWLQCDGSGNSCAPIAGATTQSYVLLAGDVGHVVKVQETASNAAGTSNPAVSAGTAVVTPLPPSNELPPTITGIAKQGQPLTEVHGKWANNPTSFTYQWLQCDGSGNNCAAISGATSGTYAPAASDVGHTIAVQETATNAGGSSSPASSSATAVVQATKTFGKTTVGASTDTFASERKRVNGYALPEAGSVTKLTIYLAPTGKTGEQVLKGVIYSDVGGKPEALLGVSEQLTFKGTNTAGWYDLQFASPVKLAAGNYWIGVMTGATAGVTGFRYDTVAGARAWNANTYTSGPTNPFGSITTDGEQMSLYATY